MLVRPESGRGVPVMGGLRDSEGCFLCQHGFDRGIVRQRESSANGRRPAGRQNLGYDANLGAAGINERC
jgi:hypothetical protein